MGKHRARLLVCGVGCVVLIVTSTLLLDWFHATIAVDLGSTNVEVDRLAISLRSLHRCSAEGSCANLPLSTIKGFYSSSAETSLWGSLLFMAFVALQAGTRLLSGAASARLTKIGYGLGSMVLSSVLCAGYLFLPESTSLAIGSIDVQRTWAPLMLMVAYVLGFAALALSVSSEVSEDDVGEYKPVVIPGEIPVRGATWLKPVARVVLTGRDDSTAVALAPRGDEPPAVRRSTPRAGRSVGKVAASETREQLRKQLLYATAMANISGPGIDATREDGLEKLVRWRDVVGVVARRLPPHSPYDSITFIDVVSTAGATLRILPWTRVGGLATDMVVDDLEDEEMRARSFVQLVVLHRPEVHLDPATRIFLGSRGHAAQLPDVEMLDAHDARLA